MADSTSAPNQHTARLHHHRTRVHHAHAALHGAAVETVVKVYADRAAAGPNATVGPPTTTGGANASPSHQ